MQKTNNNQPFWKENFFARLLVPLGEKIRNHIREKKVKESYHIKKLNLWRIHQLHSKGRTKKSVMTLNFKNNLKENNIKEEKN
ncbi:hypothetical protein PTKIN_Ptkin02bG0122800 [Pterospermum kingtungense]